jgi:hypothetical protein
LQQVIDGSNTKFFSRIGIKKPRLKTGVIKLKFGSDLLSHTPAHAVPSAYRGLTSLFGMGRGVTPWLKPPKFKLYYKNKVKERKSRAK